MTDRREEGVSFDVRLRAPGSGHVPHVTTIDQCRPPAGAIEKCRRCLSTGGMTCHETDFGLACTATRERFESLFRVRLRPAAAPGIPPFEIVGEIHVPQAIEKDVEEITLSAPPEFF